MASALALLKKGASHMEITTHHRGTLAAAGETAIGVGLDALVGGGVSYGLGQLYHRYPDKWYGEHAPKILAGVGKIAAVILGATGHGYLAGAVNSVGQAGVNAYALELGLKHARKSTGKELVMMPKGAQLPAGAQRVTSIGDLPPAQPGRGMTWDQVEQLNKMV